MSSRFGLNENLEKILNAPYPFDVVDENKEKAGKKFGGDFIIDFGIGDPSDPTPELVREACKKAVDETKAAGYPDVVGGERFLDAVRHYMKKRFNVTLAREELTPTYGAKYASFHIPQYFLNPGKGEITLIPNPGYPPYSGGTIMAGGVPYYMNIMDVNDFQPDFDGIPAEILKKARILFLNSPHSPTGKIYGKEKLKEAVDLSNDNNIILVSDECYSDLYFEKQPMSILEIKNAEECSLTLNSLSKRSMMTGYAVGFIASKNPELLNTYTTIQKKSIQGVANIIQHAAATAFMDEKHPEEMRSVYRRRRDALIPALEKTGCTVNKPEGTFFIWARVPGKTTPVEYSEKLLLGKGINCVPGNLISKTQDKVNPGEKYVRFALVQEIERIREAVERLNKN